MFKKIVAIVAAAASATFIVTFVPGIAPEVKASTSQAIEQIISPGALGNAMAVASITTGTTVHNSVEQNAQSDGRDHKIVCDQAWPYYAESCLRDRNQHAGNARIVRIVTDRSAVTHAGRSRH